MRRHRILLVFFLSLALQADAQRDEGASMGVRAGMSLPFFDFKGFDVSTSPGISAGLFSKAPITGDLFFYVEISGVYERVTVSQPLTPGSFTDVDFLYAECTFMAAYNVSGHVSLNAGPFVGYLAYYKQTPGGQPDFWNELFDRDHFNDVNLGFIYSASYEFNRFDVGLRFNHGLFVIGKEAEDEVFRDALKTKNAYVQLFGAYLF
jgi:hypothetical protein